MKLDMLAKHQHVMCDTTEVLTAVPTAILIVNYPSIKDGEQRPQSRFLMPDGEFYSAKVTRYNNRSRIDDVGAIFNRQRQFCRFKHVETVSETAFNTLEFGIGSEQHVKMYYGDGDLCSTEITGDALTLAEVTALDCLTHENELMLMLNGVLHLIRERPEFWVESTPRRHG